MRSAQAVDPGVSVRKFEREIAEFRRLAGDYRRRGWYMAEAKFPTVVVVLAAPQVKPTPIVLGVRFDYTDYDFRPPSVRLIDPVTSAPYKANELPVQLIRAMEVPAQLPPGFQLPPGMELPKAVQHQNLMVNYGADDIPFLCIAGVREYHDHPGHTGDSWDLHRKTGAGRLVRLLEVINKYAVGPIRGYNVNLLPQVAGYALGELPS